MSAYTKDAMCERFWGLFDQKEALIEELAPSRKKRDELRNKLRPLVAEYKAAKLDVVAIERPRMGEIDSEMAVIARALGNKVGERPGA